MKSLFDDEPQYRYVRFGRHSSKVRYLCLDHPPLLLAWLLYRSGKPFGFPGKGLRRALAGCKHLLRVIITLFYYRLFSPPFEDVLNLPIFGHLCLLVNSGCKVFDLRRQVVVKALSPDLDMATVRDEIEQVRRVGAYQFAPTVLRWNVEERWYEEAYADGYHAAAPDWPNFVCALQESLIPLIARIITAMPQEQRKALEYIQEQSELFRSRCSKLSARGLDARKLATIIDFVDTTIDRLRLAGDYPIVLVWSHGDFSFARHVIATRHGPIVVDWDAGGKRSALYDLYDAFFKQLRRGCSAQDMAVALERAVFQLQSNLALIPSGDSSRLISSLYAADTYRWIYYIERTACSVFHIDRVLLRSGVGKKLTDLRLDRILRYIGAYARYEAEVVNRSREQTREDLGVGHHGRQVGALA